MPKILNTSPLVVIEWEDHVTEEGWQQAKDIGHAPGMVQTVGWLIREDEKGISLCSSVSPTRGDGEVGHHQYILKNCITNRWVLRKGK